MLNVFIMMLFNRIDNSMCLYNTLHSLHLFVNIRSRQVTYTCLLLVIHCAYLPITLNFVRDFTYYFDKHRTCQILLTACF